MTVKSTGTPQAGYVDEPYLRKVDDAVTANGGALLDELTGEFAVQAGFSHRGNLRVVHSGSTITLEDVSREAGVSKSTASRALCDSPNVKAETRERVQRVASRLGYVPNDAARQLAARRVVVMAAMHGVARAEADARAHASMTRASGT